MIYNTQKAFELGKKDVTFLDAGIHEDVSFSSIRKAESRNNSTFIEFEFEKDGMRLTHTEYEPTKFGDMTQEKFEARVNTQVARILQILSAYYDESALVFNTDSFDKFADWVVTLMTAVDKNTKVRIKAVYGRDGRYVGLPSYAKYTFIEPMSVSTSKIKRLSIDQFERSEQPEMDREEDSKSASQVFGAQEQPTINNEGQMPF